MLLGGEGWLVYRKSKKNYRVLVCISIMTFAGAAGPLLNRVAAQGATAALQGTVTDMSGAAITEATIQVRNVGTGAAQSATTDAQGRFSVLDLAVGAYEVQALKTGFTAVVHKGITLNV